MTQQQNQQCAMQCRPMPGEASRQIVAGQTQEIVEYGAILGEAA
jgi:hypothetical protein